MARRMSCSGVSGAQRRVQSRERTASSAITSIKISLPAHERTVSSCGGEASPREHALTRAMQTTALVSSFIAGALSTSSIAQHPQHPLDDACWGGCSTRTPS